MIYRAISLWQPWSSAMAAGLKRNETRSWPTEYRGPLAIHASKRWTREEREVFEELRAEHEPFFSSAGMHAGWKPPLGYIVCVVNVKKCVATADININDLSALEYDLGNYESGRFAWQTDNMRPLKRPLPVNGRQGFFNVDIPDNYL